MNSRTLAALGLTGWTPIRLFWANGEPCVDWCRLPAEPLREPFFEQSVGQAMCSPARMLFRRQTSADVLEAIGREVAGDGAANSSRNGRSPQEFAGRAEASGPRANTSSDTSASSCEVSGSRRGNTRMLTGDSQHGRDAHATIQTHGRDACATAESPSIVGAIVPPAGFVFHVSRCGSTLISQMLAALSRNLVLSEPPPVDQVLTAHLVDPRVTRERRIAWLRGLMAALCQPRTGEERHAFIKFECLSVLDHELIAEAFPEVPRVFLYRDPVEVLVSLQRSLPAQMLPGVVDPRRLGFAPGFPPAQSLEHYIAQLLVPVFAAELTGASGEGARLVNFSELPAVLWLPSGGLFSRDWTDEERLQMQESSRRDAKHPVQAHRDDRAAKQRAAGDGIRLPAKRWLTPLYDQLEQRRLTHHNDSSGAISAPAGPGAAPVGTLVPLPANLALRSVPG